MQGLDHTGLLKQEISAYAHDAMGTKAMYGFSLNVCCVESWS
jgi:hypothetical protein